MKFRKNNFLSTFPTGAKSRDFILAALEKKVTENLDYFNTADL